MRCGRAFAPFFVAATIACATWLSVAVVIGQPVFTIFSALARMTRVGQPQQSVASSAFCVDHLLTSFPERFVMRMADLS
jgi:hypothetical protein